MPSNQEYKGKGSTEEAENFTSVHAQVHAFDGFDGPSPRVKGAPQAACLNHHRLAPPIPFPISPWDHQYYY